MNEQKREIVQRAVHGEARRAWRVGFTVGVLLGIAIGAGLGLVIAYHTIDQVIVVAMGPCTQA